MILKYCSRNATAQLLVCSSCIWTCSVKHEEKAKVAPIPSTGKANRREDMLHLDSEPPSSSWCLPSKLPAKLDWHGMVQAGGRSGRQLQQESEADHGRMCPPASCILIADWYIDCHWLYIVRQNVETRMTAERETMEISVAFCVCLCVSVCVCVCLCTWVCVSLHLHVQCVHVCVLQLAGVIEARALSALTYLQLY